MIVAIVDSRDVSPLAVLHHKTMGGLSIWAKVSTSLQICDRESEFRYKGFRILCGQTVCQQSPVRSHCNDFVVDNFHRILERRILRKRVRQMHHVVSFLCELTSDSIE